MPRERAADEQPKLRIEYVDPQKLAPNPWNSNVVGPENEAKLVESIRRFGAYKPIVVRETADGLQIIGGEHRCRAAQQLGHREVPIVNLGRLSDRKAKEIGLADNGRYGEDDTLRLAELLKDLGTDDVTAFLPVSSDELASIFAASNIVFDDLELPADDAAGDLPVADTKLPQTHVVMRFKVPLEDSQRVERFFERLIRAKGYSSEKDSMVAAGMALVDAVGMAEAAP